MNGRPWTDAELRRLRHFYPHIKTEHLARILRRALHAVYKKAMSLKLRKTAKYLASPDACRLRRESSPRSIACRFMPGHVPWTKGLKGYDAGGRSHETRFKKGTLNGRAARLYVPVGTERVNTDGYRERKMTDEKHGAQRWRGVHILLWEEHYGPLPPGHMVCFINGDKTDIRMDNFVLLNRRDRMRVNSFHNRYPKEIGRLIQLRCALVRQINRREKYEKSNRRSA